jgi:hypothetical protein
MTWRLMYTLMSFVLSDSTFCRLTGASCDFAAQ